MHVAHDFNLRGLLERVIEWHDLSLIIERGESDGTAAGDVDESIEMQDAIFTGDVERAASENDLDVRIESAVIVCELEAARQRQRFPAANVGEPNQRAADSASGVRESHTGR